MADVTISSLSPIAPATGLFLPASNGTTTGSVTMSQVCGVMTANQITTALGYTPLNGMPAGSILQVQQAYKKDIWGKGGAGTQNIWWDVDGLSVTMNLVKPNSKILVSGTINFSRDCNGNDAFLRLLRNDALSTANSTGGTIGHAAAQISILQANPVTFAYLDTPTQTANTYKIQAYLSSTACTMFVNVRGINDGGAFTLTSNLTLMEIAQ